MPECWDGVGAPQRPGAEKSPGAEAGKAASPASATGIPARAAPPSVLGQASEEQLPDARRGRSKRNAGPRERVGGQPAGGAQGSSGALPMAGGMVVGGGLLRGPRPPPAVETRLACRWGLRCGAGRDLVGVLEVLAEAENGAGPGSSSG